MKNRFLALSIILVCLINHDIARPSSFFDSLCSNIQFFTKSIDSHNKLLNFNIKHLLNNRTLLLKSVLFSTTLGCLIHYASKKVEERKASILTERIITEIGNILDELNNFNTLVDVAILDNNNRIRNAHFSFHNLYKINGYASIMKNVSTLSKNGIKPQVITEWKQKVALLKANICHTAQLSCLTFLSQGRNFMYRNINCPLKFTSYCPQHHDTDSVDQAKIQTSLVSLNHIANKKVFKEKLSKKLTYITHLDEKITELQKKNNMLKNKPFETIIYFLSNIINNIKIQLTLLISSVTTN